MPKVIADITMSLYGFVTGPGADPDHGLGDAEHLHDWVAAQDSVDTGPRSAAPDAASPSRSAPWWSWPASLPVPPPP